MENIILFYVCVGAEIDCEDKSRNTALHIAARYGHELIITALIKHGANTAKLVTTDIHHLSVFLLHVICAVVLKDQTQVSSSKPGNG